MPDREQWCVWVHNGNEYIRVAVFINEKGVLGNDMAEIRDFWCDADWFSPEAWARDYATRLQRNYGPPDPIALPEGQRP